jgi:hypothetical protein
MVRPVSQFQLTTVRPLEAESLFELEQPKMEMSYGGFHFRNQSRTFCGDGGGVLALIGDGVRGNDTGTVGMVGVMSVDVRVLYFTSSFLRLRIGCCLNGLAVPTGIDEF